MITINRNLIIMISAMVVLNSCSEDFITTTPPSVLSEANYYQNISELETGLNSCYSIVNHYFYSWWWGQHLPTILSVIGNMGSDGSEAGGGTGGGFIENFGGEISVSAQNSSNVLVMFWWQINFELIARCNLVIDKSAQMPDDTNPIELEKLVDQAKFLRAFAYYNLVTIFGDVPLPTSWLNPDELNLERSSDSLVWIQIENDLADASNLPPQSKSQRGRATQGAVLAMQGKVFLWQKKYSEAIEAYESVIQSGEYQLMDEYGDIHHPDGENCRESIFEFQEENGVTGGDMASCLGICRLPRDELVGGWGCDTPSQDLFEEFEPGDPRIIYTFNFIGDIFPHPNSQYTVQNLDSQTGYTCRKAWIPFRYRPESGNLPAYNWRYCRYAEVLLFYAEALNEAEPRQPEEAKEYLNMVRKRARLSSLDDPERDSCVWDLSISGERLPDVVTSDQSELRQAIWHEQRVELATEGHRRWILLRTGRLKERMEAAKGHLGCVVDDHEWLYPIPWEEVGASNGLITQNPGYN